MARRVRLTVGYRSLHRDVAPDMPSLPGYTRAIRNRMAKIEKAITTELNRVEGLTPAAVEYALEPAYALSQAYVPEDTGALKESGFIQTERKAHGAVGVVGYGQAGKPIYAVFVHERTDQQHKPPERAKFLEEAVNKTRHKIVPRAAEFLKNNTGV